MRAFRLIERDSSPGCRRIEIEGEVDLAVLDHLRAALRGAERSRRVLIDLERCDFIDLAALALLVRAGCGGQATKRWITVYGSAGQPLRLFMVVGLADGLILKGGHGTTPHLAAG
ncbi:MAG TPA: STAS domain-containing protein [Solirubrobacterales bacterium]|nr:STAS domain-containing protein [Solirubrobacterales bacterium]